MAIPAEDWAEPEPIPPDPRTMKAIPIERLIVDPQIQREQGSERVQRLAHEWDWARAEVPTVAALRSNFRVVEGGHRIMALRHRNYTGKVWCAVIEPTGTAEEVDVALSISKGRRPHSAYEQWQARLRRGDKHEVMAEKVLADHGLRLGRSPSATTITCAAVLKKIVHGRNQTPEVGADVLDQVLTIVTFAYPEHDHESITSRFNGELLRAISYLLVRNLGVIREDRLVDTLKAQEAPIWLSRARSGHDSTWMVLRHKLAAEYNRHLKAERRIDP